MEGSSELILLIGIMEWVRVLVPLAAILIAVLAVCAMAKLM